MKKVIIITGALGYIGTELCKLYSGFSWKYEVIGIDNRFISERVNELKRRKIKFIQADILNIDEIKPYIQKGDVVHHLAGITDVAYVKKDSNKEQDEKIKTIAIEGTRNVINSINSKCKLIFPSTHVIYEGLKNTKENIHEDEKPCPILAYSSSKVQNENEIKSSNKNYIILRLGSVYGYSTDTMRINIMPNLFSKIASQNGTINLFSGGKQIKSLVPLIDVARCMKFMAENPRLNQETFNLTKESITVKEVAEICKKINPKIVYLPSVSMKDFLCLKVSTNALSKGLFSFQFSSGKFLYIVLNARQIVICTLLILELYSGAFFSKKSSALFTLNFS